MKHVTFIEKLQNGAWIPFAWQPSYNEYELQERLADLECKFGCEFRLARYTWLSEIPPAWY